MASCRCWQPTPFFCSQRRWERRLCDCRSLGSLGGFTAIFWISYACWIGGSYAYIAATPDKLASFGIPWSLNLTSEAGFIIALLAGLVVGNFLPRFAVAIGPAIRPEWYIKTAIVILGGVLGHCRHGAMGLATAVMFRGLCAIVEAYLIYWGWSTSWRGNSSSSAANGLRRWLPGSPFAGFPLPLRPVLQSGRGPSCRSWCRRLW